MFLNKTNYHKCQYLKHILNVFCLLNSTSVLTQIFGLFGWKFEPKFSVDGTHSAGRDELGGSGRMCFVTGKSSGPRGPSPQALNPFGGVGFITQRLRRPF